MNTIANIYNLLDRTLQLIFEQKCDHGSSLTTQSGRQCAFLWLCRSLAPGKGRACLTRGMYFNVSRTSCFGLRPCTHPYPSLPSWHSSRFFSVACLSAQLCIRHSHTSSVCALPTCHTYRYVASASISLALVSPWSIPSSGQSLSGGRRSWMGWR